MEFHELALSHLCRVCPGSIDISKGPADVILCAKEIQVIWNINIWQDQKGVHSKYICHKCYRQVRHQRNGSREYTFNSDFKLFDWQPHRRTGNCPTCSRYRERQLGTRGNRFKFKATARTTSGPVKKSPNNLPFSSSSPDIFLRFHTESASQTSTSYHLSISDSVPHHQHHFYICPLCLCILSNPVYSTCHHSFCSDCLTKLFQFHSDTTVTCPVCQELFTFHSVQSCPEILTVQLFHLSVKCDKCGSKGKLSELVNHNCPRILTSSQTQSSTSEYSSNQNTCTGTGTLSPLSAAANTLQQLAKNHKPGDPVPAKIAAITDRWTWLRLKASADRSLTLRTRGLVSHNTVKLLNFAGDLISLILQVMTIREINTCESLNFTCEIKCLQKKAVIFNLWN